MGYAVKLPHECEDLDTMLEKVRKGQLDPLELDMQAVATAVSQARENPDNTHLQYSEALLVISQLVFYKSKALLPLDKEEKKDEQVSEANAEREDDFAKYRELTDYLEKLETDNARAFVRQSSLRLENELSVNDYLDEISLDELSQALQQVMQRFRKSDKPMNFAEEVEREPFTLQDKIKSLRALLGKSRKKIEFGQLFGEANSRLEIIVTFLAMLELIRNKELKVQQERRFGPIMLVRG